MSIIAPLIQQLRKEASEEKEKLQKSHRLEIEKLDGRFQKELSELEKKLKQDMEKEKEKVLESYKEEKKFQLRMKKLSLKEEFFKEAVLKMKKSLENLPFEKRKIFYEKKLQSIGRENIKKVLAPASKRKEAEALLPNVEIIEKPFDIDGFIAEGEKFSFEVSLSSIVDGLASEKKGDLSLLLFS